MVARAGFLAGLGITTAPHPSGMGEHVVVDATGRTDVPGVWAAGNVTDLSAQVGASAAAGAWPAPRSTWTSSWRTCGRRSRTTGPHPSASDVSSRTCLDSPLSPATT